MTAVSGLFISEGSSDHPLADVVERLFQRRGVDLTLSTPDFALLASRVGKTVESRLRAAYKLRGSSAPLVVVHRDGDNAGRDARLGEIQEAVARCDGSPAVLPVVPIRMTEAWLLLDEQAIRRVAGNPSGTAPLNLPNKSGIERHADPKKALQVALLAAADETGRRRKVVQRRFNQHRRQLLEGLDIDGPVTELNAWRDLVRDVEAAVEHVRAEAG